MRHSTKNLEMYLKLNYIFLYECLVLKLFTIVIRKKLRFIIIKIKKAEKMYM